MGHASQSLIAPPPRTSVAKGATYKPVPQCRRTLVTLTMSGLHMSPKLELMSSLKMQNALELSPIIVVYCTALIYLQAVPVHLQAQGQLAPQADQAWSLKGRACMRRSRHDTANDQHTAAHQPMM